MVICLERDADLHMSQLMPVSLTVSCFSIIQIGFTFLVLAHPGSPGQSAVKRACVCCYFSDIHISQGSEATCSRCGGILKHNFLVDLLQSLI